MFSQVDINDSINGVDTTVIPHSPKRAAVLSAILPGLGQVYNQKYWKVPLVYAAIGTLTYFIIDYNKKYNTYVNAYKDYDAYLRGDLTKTSFNNIRGLENYSDKTYFLKSYTDFYRRWRDLDVLILAGVYMLNIIDANVDAHFFNFRIDDNLAVNVKPVIFEPFNSSKQVGISLNLSF